jgi:thioredoxin reductase
MVIVGGGPASAIQLHAGGVPAEDILVISDRWGTGMDFMAEASLQSYVEELAIDGGDPFPEITADGLQPSAREYGAFVRRTLLSSGATLAEARIGEISRNGDLFELQISAAGSGSGVVRAEQVVLATGSRPRRPPTAWAESGALTFDLIYQMPPSRRRSLLGGRSVVVVGSGNSAMQTAALVAPLASDTLILATRYQGMFPFETLDRFAWRSHSALTCELVVKSAQSCRDSASSVTCVRFLVYRSLSLTETGLEMEYTEEDNTNILGSRSLPGRCRHATGRKLPAGGWSERRSSTDVVVIWATGSEPVYPPSQLLEGIDKDVRGSIHCDSSGRTDVPGLYLVGACSGRRSVNEMQPALAASVKSIR